jgi:hypothetical protein
MPQAQRPLPVHGRSGMHWRSAAHDPMRMLRARRSGRKRCNAKPLAKRIQHGTSVARQQLTP